MIDLKKLSEIEPIDIKIKLLKGTAMSFDMITIPKITLEYISNIGYMNFMRAVSFLTIPIDDFLSTVDANLKKEIENELDNLTIFDFFISLGGEDIQQAFLDSLSIILQTDDVRIVNNKFIGVDFENDMVIEYDEYGDIVWNEGDISEITSENHKIIDRNNFQFFVKGVKLMTSFPNESNDDVIDDFMPLDPRARRLKEKMLANRKRVEKIKENQKDKDGSIDFYNLIDAVTVKSNNINKINVWNLTLYQLYSEYLRLDKIEEYELSIKAIMAGAENVKQMHWSDDIT